MNSIGGRSVKHCPPVENKVDNRFSVQKLSILLYVRFLAKPAITFGASSRFVYAQHDERSTLC